MLRRHDVATWITLLETTKCSAPSARLNDQGGSEEAEPPRHRRAQVPTPSRSPSRRPDLETTASRRLGGGFGFANLSPAQHNASFGGEAQKGADGAVDDEKRMVYTGPNPLHNK
ncbi:hypothetical protein MUK42_34247 [Musa troglodytarum]|uniref:Uncharacterized protein n=1 Tax=Musa troglodytarum TaxID=320322 RepID=A0A9E7GC73_9LILI|nr:hypothetical protein MUK42_34247 [Musa troglodytarum]